MNIFYLHEDPIQNVKWHVDKHVVKMATEYAQLLSTAHRFLDGELYEDRTKNNHRIKRWKLPDERENVLYKASHVNHPCNVWVRESKSNYRLMYQIYMACLAEYTYRYGKIHGASKPSISLLRTPNNIKDIGLTEVPQAMPEYCKVTGNPIQAYKNYYINEKNGFANWKNRTKPEWYKEQNADIHI